MRSLYQIFHPEIFQGSLKRKNYFEGWYFKHVSAGGEEAFAVIPGISLSDDTHAFIQYNNGTDSKSSYFRYDISDFRYDRKKINFSIGNSRFTTEGISLDLSNENYLIRGEIKYSKFLKPPSGILMPGIMGWYSYVPWMECNHGVVSITHEINGSVSVNGNTRQFGGGKGYIEKDWGISFPESWLWMQCNNFSSPGASVMISVGKIPWKGNFFIGFVAFFSLNGRTSILATYNGAEIISLSRKGEYVTETVIRKRDMVLKATITKKGEGVLKAPSSGLMINTIKESIDSDITLEIKEAGKTIFSETGIRAGYEETAGIFKYFK